MCCQGVSADFHLGFGAASLIGFTYLYVNISTYHVFPLIFFGCSCAPCELFILQYSVWNSILNTTELHSRIHSLARDSVKAEEGREKIREKLLPLPLSFLALVPLRQFKINKNQSALSIPTRCTLGRDVWIIRVNAIQWRHQSDFSNNSTRHNPSFDPACLCEMQCASFTADPDESSRLHVCRWHFGKMDSGRRQPPNVYTKRACPLRSLSVLSSAKNAYWMISPWREAAWS